MSDAVPSAAATKPNVGGLQWPAGLSVAVLGPVIALVLACAFFATQSDHFLSGGNFSLILQQVAVVGVIAIGQTLVILTGGIDRPAAC
jgi:fructose transport system permease protein